MNKTTQPFIPYGRQSIDDDDIAAVVATLRSSHLTQGPIVAEFERALSTLLRVRFAVAVNSGTSALHIACRAAGIGSGDEVITSPITFLASANCTLYCGGTLVFADIDPATATIDPKEIARRITSKTKAIIPVHFAGQACDMTAIIRVVRDAEQRFGHKIWIIEDACHVLDSKDQGQIVGSCTDTDMAVLSFHPVKHVTTGEGGAVVTNDPDIAARLALLRSHGMTKDPALLSENPGPWYYEQIDLGYNYRITDLQCALGLSQLKKLSAFSARRRIITARYRAAFANTPHVTLLAERPGTESTLHLFVLRIDFSAVGKDRATVMKELTDRGVGTQVHYIPVHLQPYYRKFLGTTAGDYPHAEAYYQQCLSVPLFAAMTDVEVERVIAAVRAVLAESPLPLYSSYDMITRDPQKVAALIAKRHTLIPGAAHTYSKGDDQFPANAPKVILRGEGAYVWGEDGRKYLDWCMGLRSVSLGHRYPRVNDAVRAQMEEGTNFGRPHIIEYELAEELVNLLPNTEMVKFAKNGSTVTTAATKLARACTGRKYIAVCKDHPFFSYDDWFVGTTVCAAGVPQEIRDLTVTFRYNNIESVRAMFAAHPGEIACVIMEAVTTEEPKNDFLHEIERLTKAEGALFILDEMITGFRFDLRGAQTRYGLTPDLTTYGKGIANGYSVAVLAGRKDVMELGGLLHDKERVFLVSTTHGAETIGLAAARATIAEMREKNVQAAFWERGDRIRKELIAMIARHGLGTSVRLMGFSPNLIMGFFEHDGTSSLVLRTIYLQELVKRGILSQAAFPISFSHGDAEITQTLEAIDAILPFYKQALDDKDHRERYLEGSAVKPVFRTKN